MKPPKFRIIAVAGAAPSQDRAPFGAELRLDKQLRERRVIRIGLAATKHPFQVTRQFQASCSIANIGHQAATDLEIMPRGDTYRQLAA